MCTNNTLTGILPDDLHKLRYQCVVNKEGQKLFYKVFTWSYLGGNLSVKEYLSTIPNYTNDLYKKQFNAHQRTKLNAGIPTSSFDISLLYKLLCHVCNLQKDKAWSSEDPAGPTLENLIYKVKEHRNLLAHEDLQMNEQQLQLKLNELQLLYKRVICEAGIRFSKPASETNRIIIKINNNINGFCKKIREPFGPNDIALYQQEVKEFREQLESIIKQAAREEVEQLYADTCNVHLVPWLLVDYQIKPIQIFTRFVINEDATSHSFAEEEQSREISVNNILEVKRDHKLPEVLILTGEGGMGKTTFLKYLTEVWITDPEMIPGLDKVELLLYIECRHPAIRTFDQLLKHTLHATSRNVNVEFEIIREAILHMQLLILVDGFDEVNEASGNLIREVLNLPRHTTRIIFTTRPDSTNTLTKLIPQSKRRVNLVMNGITPDHHQQFVEKLCCSLISEERWSHIRVQLKETFSVLKQQLGMHLNNPLTLTLVTLLFLKDQNTFNMLTTATDLYDELRKLLTEKLTERLSKYTFDSELEFKCYQFLEYSDALAFRAMKRQEYELQSETVKNLKEKCSNLGLRHTEVLSAYFTTRRSRQGLVPCLYYTYHHLKLQEFSVAKHLLKEITQCTNPEENIKNFLIEGEMWKKEKRFQNVLVHLTSLLAKTCPDTLARYATFIIDMVHLDTTCIDYVLAHVTESKHNEWTVKAVAAKLDMHTSVNSWWQIDDYNNLKSLSSVLECTQVSPNMVILSIKSSIIPQDLALALDSLSKHNTKLALDFPQNYFGLDSCPVDEAMLRLSSSEGPCRLVGFRGPLTPEALVKIPECVEELRLLIEPDGLHALNTRLPSLGQLNILGVKYEDKDRRDPSTLPVLQFSGTDLCFTFNPIITDNTLDLDWASAIFARLCAGRESGSCTSILFRKTHLTEHGGEKLLEALHQKGVRVKKRMDINSSYRLSPDGYNRLQNLAKSLHLREFLWHQNKEQEMLQ